MANVTIWIDTKDNAVVLTDELDAGAALKTFDDEKAAYRFAVDLETFLRAHGVDADLEYETKDGA